VLRSIRGRKFLQVAVLCAAFAASAPVPAETLRYDGPMYAPYFGTFAINGNPPAPSLSRTVYAGAFEMTNLSSAPGNSFMAWCVDIYGTIQRNANYSLRTGVEFYGVGSRVITDLERLASYAFGNWTVANNVASAAFQLAVWEIVTETAAGYSLRGNNFTVTAGSSTVRNLASSWLEVVNAGTYAVDQQLGIWQKDAGSMTQNLAVFTPIPEPETYVMLLAGLGLMVFVAKRRGHGSALRLDDSRRHLQ